jgi:hypothetical protein
MDFANNLSAFPFNNTVSLTSVAHTESNYSRLLGSQLINQCPNMLKLMSIQIEPVPYPSSVRMTKESLPKPDLIANLIWRKAGSLRHSGFSFSFLALSFYMVLSVHS